MQYALLIYQGTTPLPDADAWASLSAAEQQAVYADYAALNVRPGVTPGLPLGLADKARTVRVVDGGVVAVDGPYAEPVGGYFVLEPATSTLRSRWRRASRRLATAGPSRSARSRRTGDRPRRAR